MEITDLEKRISAIEVSLQKKIENKINLIFKTRLEEIESRMVTLIDSKADATESYLKLKKKVDCTDFERLLSQVLCFKQRTEDIAKTFPEQLVTIKRAIEENKKVLDEELKQRIESDTKYKTQSISDILQQLCNNNTERIVVLERCQYERNEALSELKNKLHNIETKNQIEIDTIKRTQDEGKQHFDDFMSELKKRIDLFTSTHKQTILHAEILEKLKETVETFAKKMLFVESNQNVTNNKEEINALSESLNKSKVEYMELVQEVKIGISRINDLHKEIKAEFIFMRESLNTEYSRVRSENMFLLEEHERIYNINRETENTLMKLKNECKNLIDFLSKKDYMTTLTTQLNNTLAISSQTRNTNTVRVTQTPSSSISVRKRRMLSIGSRQKRDDKVRNTGEISLEVNVGDSKNKTLGGSFVRRANRTPHGVTLNRFKNLMDLSHL